MDFHPVMGLGFALFSFGFFVLLGVLVGSGGAARSRQFRVLGELLRGERGPTRRWTTWAAGAFLMVGAMLCFLGVLLNDQARAQACQDMCEAGGYSDARIGPNSNRTKDRKTWWVACICEGPGLETLERRADAL